MTLTLQAIIEKFNVKITESEAYLSPARTTVKQRERCDALEELLNEATSFKRQAIAHGSEDDSNLFLGFECAIGAILCELRMWILLKKDNPNGAWVQLVAAQMGIADAARSHIGFGNLNAKMKRLEEIESIIFPPQTFLSAGFTSGYLECSICGQNYSKCDHLRNKPYMGRLCEVIHRKIRANHLAIVKHPADKRCRIVSTKTALGFKDKLSLKITPYKKGEKYTDDGTLEAQSILMSTNRFPYLDSNVQVLNKRRDHKRRPR
ncbi:hypothetical protein PQR12_21770 [Paraburkholderia nemoris]|uniref:hypothetical protein n=1 Tax=Paraburkholderia nemoris TaxID=2793076 RepID=UPI0038B781AD